MNEIVGDLGAEALDNLPQKNDGKVIWDLKNSGRVSGIAIVPDGHRSMGMGHTVQPCRYSGHHSSISTGSRDGSGSAN